MVAVRAIWHVHRVSMDPCAWMLNAIPRAHCTSPDLRGCSNVTEIECDQWGLSHDLNKKLVIVRAMRISRVRYENNVAVATVPWVNAWINKGALLSMTCAATRKWYKGSEMIFSDEHQRRWQSFPKRERIYFRFLRVRLESYRDSSSPDRTTFSFPDLRTGGTRLTGSGCGSISIPGFAFDS